MVVETGVSTADELLTDDTVLTDGVATADEDVGVVTAAYEELTDGETTDEAVVDQVEAELTVGVETEDADDENCEAYCC